MTLYELMTAGYIHSCRKHDLAEDCDEYAREKLNEMSNAELVYTLSQALETLKETK